MKHFLVIFTCLLGNFSVLGQYLIPYQGQNNKYGYMTEAGEVVVPPRYDRLPGLFDTQIIDYEVARYGNGYEVLFKNGTTHLLYPSKPAGGFECVFNEQVALSLLPWGAAPELRRRLPDLLYHYYPDSVLFFNLKNQKIFTLLDQHTQSASKYYFHYGRLKVKKDRNRVNFIDKNLDFALKKDYFDADFIHQNYIVIHDSTGRQALLDTLENIVLPPDTCSIMATFTEHSFIINNPRLDAFWYTALSRQEYAFIQDIYHHKYADSTFCIIFPLSRDYLVGIKKNEWNLINYKGENVGLPDVKYYYQFRSGHFLVRDSSNYNIVDLEGNRLNKHPYRQVTPKC